MVRQRTILITIAALALMVAGGLAASWHAAIDPITIADRPTAPRLLIQRGAELAAVGGCATCHTAPGKLPYAGGLPLPTPFGTVYATNITPDVETGIGSWSAPAFHRAMRQGIDRKGRHLYPAFPYDHFTNSTDADIQAIYAFLMSSPAVNNAVPKTALPFPLNIRMLVAGWNFLFLQKGELIPDRAQTADWNRGRYLADGLGHCGACHTPRNLLGAEKKGESYAGAFAEGWFAPALNGTARVPHGWTADQLTEYLSTGWHPVHGAAAGPMAEVVKNLQMVPAADVRAIAVYIASLSVKAGNANAPTRERVPSNASPEIVAIFKGSCAQCHSEASIGPSKAVPLSMSATLRQESSANTVRVIREGIDAYRRTGGPYMPGFGTMLTDSQIAGLADYVRSRFTDLAQWGDIQSEILKAKEAPAQ